MNGALIDRKLASRFSISAKMLTCLRLLLASTLPWLVPAIHGEDLGNPLGFSAQPTDQEIFNVRMFDEPVIPGGGKPQAEENAALAHALNEFASAESEDFSSLTAFLDTHPTSRWRGSLLLHLGTEYYSAGYYSLALQAWEEAWRWWQNNDDHRSKPQADRALGELARMYSRLGRTEQLGELLRATKGRNLTGPGTTLIGTAEQTFWTMQHQPGTGFRCGPLALEAILADADPNQVPNRVILESRSTTNGCSLLQVAEISRQVGLNYQMAYRSAGAPIICPAVVHWKAGHYAAVLRPLGDRFKITDYTFPSSFSISSNALNVEGSGYFLVPGGPLPEGWRSVSRSEGQGVWGSGPVSQRDVNATRCDDLTVGGDGCVPPGCEDDAGGGGMAGYSMEVLLASLKITDVPVGYTPPVGPRMYFRVGYQQKEANQPAIFNFGNIGPKWTFNWLNYIYIPPQSQGGSAVCAGGGGGGTGQTAAGGTGGGSHSYSGSQPEELTQSIMNLEHDISGNPYYAILYRDGTQKLYDLVLGKLGVDRTNGTFYFMTKVIDPAGNTVHINYDSQFRITNIVDAIGQATTLSYTNTANPLVVTSVTDPFGRSAYFNYDPNGLLIQITDVLGLVSSFTYSSNDFISALTTPYGTDTFASGATNGVEWLQANDRLGQTEFLEFNQTTDWTNDIITTIPPVPPPVGTNGLANAPAFNPANGMASVDNYPMDRDCFYWDKKAFAEGYPDVRKSTLFHFLHASDLSTASAVLESVKPPLESRISFNYPGQATNNTFGNIVLGSSARPTTVGRVLDDGSTQLYSFAYNLLGNMTNATDPVGRNFTFVYHTNEIDLLEVRMTHSGKNELLRSFTYNSQHRPLTITDASGQTTVNTYNSFGQLLSTTDPLGETTTFSYDTNGYLQTITGPLQNPSDIFQFTYDSYGRLSTFTDTEGYTLTFDYDVMNRRTRTRFPDGTQEQYLYDRLDLGSTCDRLGRCNSYTHDALRRLTQARDALGRTIQFQWCQCGSQSAMIDPMGRQTRWDRDLEGRVTKKRHSDGSAITYIYEYNTSRLKSKLDEKGQQTIYTYFADNNLAAINYLNTAIPTPKVSFTYDPDYNRRVAMRDGVGTTVYSYNYITNPPMLGAGLLASVSGPLSNSVVAYKYDQLGRAISRAIDGAQAATTYDSLGRPSVVTNALGKFQYTYAGPTRRVTSTAYPDGQTNLYAYYDNLRDHRLRQIVHLKPDGSLLSSLSYTYDPAGEILSWTNTLDDSPQSAWSFGYDAAGQLTNAFLTSGGVVIDSHSYMYDAAGNRLQETTSSATNQYAYNTLNELTSAPSSLTNATYEWDAESRLTAINQNNQRVECTYDGQSRRVAVRTLINGGTATNRLFLWCGSRICEERNAAGLVVKRFYPHGVKVEAGPSPSAYFYTRDHLGSVRELMDTNGATRARYAYSPFGTRVQTAGDLDTDFGFTGHFLDKVTGLSLAWFRAYDPSLGRWLSRDPMENAEILLGPNVYSYVNNNPISLIDPDGRQGWEEIVFLVALFATAATQVDSDADATALNLAPALAGGFGVCGAAADSALTAQGTTRLWRAVEPEELKDVLKYGDYNIHPNSTFKRFAFDERSLDAFIRANRDRVYTKTYIDLPDDKLQLMFQQADPGGVGRAVGIDVYENPEFYDWFDTVNVVK